MSFEDLTYNKAEALILNRDAEWLKANKKYYEGDHWQNGSGWSGPLLPADHAIYKEVFLEIQRAFVSKNTVKEVVLRHRNGIIGLEPGWRLTPRRPLEEDEQPDRNEQTLIDEAEALLTDWWDKRSALKTIQDTTATLLWAERGLLRLFVPPGELVKVEDGSTAIPVADMPRSMMRIYLDHPQPDQSTVYTDREIMQDVGIYLYQNKDRTYAEFSYLLDPSVERPLTVIQISGSQTDDESEPTLSGTVLDLGGRLTMHEMRRDRLITDQVVQNQKLVNLALTMMQRNVVQGGYLERTFFNTQLPGHEEPDANAPGGKRFVPEPFHVGAGVTNFLSGVTYEDAEGNIQLASPSVVYREPVEVTVFKETKQAAYETILEETFQLHAAIAGDATTSGESRKQARDAFEDSLKATQAELQEAIRWLLETVLAMAAQFSGQPGRYDALRADVTCRVKLGPISADDQRVAKELVEGRIISRETGMGRVGVDDPDAEAGRIATEQEADLERQQRTLATAVLNAQRGLDGGQQSNGLEQVEGDDKPENVEATGLNGAQIRAALDILTGITDGSVVESVAVELLIALGIDRDRATRIASDTKSGAVLLSNGNNTQE